jgi:hypothetical protein
LIKFKQATLKSVRLIIFVSDAFVEHYQGGAELTTEAIIEGGYFPCNKLLSAQVTVDIMEKFKDSFWIFGNFSSVRPDCLIYAIKNLNYSVIEYDYKFCEYRSTHKHIFHQGKCECHKNQIGKLVSTFLFKSKVNFWMSQQQLNKYCELFPFLLNTNNVVLSSVFSKNTLKNLKSLETKDKNNKWIILDSPSWIKGRDAAVKYAKENDLEYELVWGLSHGELLTKLAKSKGTIFFPPGSDTCPRMIIEAKLLGCELILNENVQHKDEEWFKDKESIYAYLNDRTETFWHKIEEHAHKYLSIPFLENVSNVGFKLIVPFYNAGDWIQKCIESIKRQNYKNFECYLVDDASTDNSQTLVLESIESDDRFKFISNAKEQKKYALGNIVKSIEDANCKEEDIIILLDGDDWLASQSTLSELSNVYEKENCLLTYGSYVYCPGGMRGVEPSKYPDYVVKDNSFREDQWRASHLRTFKYKLWKNLKHEDLKDDDGEFYKMTYDQAIMLPLLELSANNSCYIDKVMHVYNKTNPLNVDKIKAQKQFDLAQKIRSKKRYKPLA